MARAPTGSYAAAVPGWHAEDAPHKAAAVLTLLREAGWAAERVVDVGCGVGEVLRGVVDALPARSGVGVDPSPELVARAPRDARLSFRVGGVEAAPHADLALALDVVEHVPDDLAFLRDLGRVAPRLVLRVPLDVSAWDAVRPGRMLAARATWGHRRVYTRDLALALCAEAGLDVVIERYDRVPLRDLTGPGRVVDAFRRGLVRAAPHFGVRAMGGWSWLGACVVR